MKISTNKNQKIIFGNGFKPLLFTLVLALGISSNADANTYYWNGSQKGADWSNILNWTPNGNPGFASGDIVSIGVIAYNNSRQPTLTVTPKYPLTSLTFGNATPGTLTITGAAVTLTVNALTLICGSAAGSAITGTGTLSLAGNVSISNGGTGTGGATISCKVNLGSASRTFTVADYGTSYTALTISGVLSATAAAGVTKAGLGTMYLSGANTYTGPTTINAGTLSVATIDNGGVAGGLGQAPSDAANLVLGGGTLQYTGASASTDRAFTLTAGTASTIVVDTSNLTISGASAITTGSLKKTGNGTLTLSGANAYTGITTIYSGTLSVSTIGNGGVAGNLGQAANDAANIVLSGGTLQYTGATASTDRAFTLTAGTTSTIDVSANNLTISGACASTTGSLTKAGAGDIIFGSNNIILKNLTINGTGSFTSTSGVLSLSGNFSNSATFIHNAGTVIFNGGVAQTITGPTTFNNLTINNTSGGVSLSSAETVAGTFTLTSGLLTTTSTNLLTITNTSAGAVSGGSSSSYVNGPLQWSVGVASYTFPIGNGGVYYPFVLNVSAASSPVVTFQAFNGDAGAAATFNSPITSISRTEYWQGTLVSGTFTGAVSVTRTAAIAVSSAIGKSTLQAGAYSSIDGVVHSPSINTSSAVSDLGYFVIGFIPIYGVNKYGESVSVPGTNFVDKNGKIGSLPALNKYGRVISPCEFTTPANAGPDQTPGCGVTTATLAGITPIFGSGAWSVVSGTATITTPGSSTSGVTGLARPGTTTLRWTITNDTCTASTDDVVITTGGGGAQTSGCGGLTAITDARDGQVYNIVQIGTQCWMAQNLNWGTQVSLATRQGTANTKYCYGDNAANCDIYGGLYEWANLMNGSASCNGDATCPPCATPVQGICPFGWHVPSHYEWTLLEKNAGSNPGAFPYDVTTNDVWLGTDEGSNLKQTGTSNWLTPNTGATNTTGFTALPGGISSWWVSSFLGGGGSGCWWSATENGNSVDYAWHRLMTYSSAQVLRDTGYPKSTGFSLRCVKD